MAIRDFQWPTTPPMAMEVGGSGGRSPLGKQGGSHEKSDPLDLENKKSLCQLSLQESYLLFIVSLTTPSMSRPL